MPRARGDCDGPAALRASIGARDECAISLSESASLSICSERAAKQCSHGDSELHRPLVIDLIGRRAPLAFHHLVQLGSFLGHMTRDSRAQVPCDDRVVRAVMIEPEPLPDLEALEVFLSDTSARPGRSHFPPVSESSLIRPCHSPSATISA